MFPKDNNLLHMAETLGWYVRRYNDRSGQEVLELGREDITCWGMEDPCTGEPPERYSLTVSAAEQGGLAQIVRDYADGFSVNRYANEFLWQQYGMLANYDFVGMEHDAELIREAMRNFHAALRHLKNAPEFSQASDAMARTSMLESAVNKFGVRLEPGKDGCWRIYYDAEDLGRCFLAYCYLESDPEEIDTTLEEVQYHLDHFDHKFQSLLENRFNKEYDFSTMLQSAHRIKEELEKLADAFEHGPRNSEEVS